MPPLNLMSVGANLLVKSLGLLSKASILRCTCVVPAIKSFSTISDGPPKRPLTGYMRFVKQQQPLVVRQHPDVKVVEIIRKIAQQWRELTPEQKKPFQEASATAREQYKEAIGRYQAQLTPAQSAALKEERRQKLAKRKAIRKKRELTNLGKPKRPRSAFNIFMAEHFEETKGLTMQGKMKTLMDDWKKLYVAQRQVYLQLAEDDKIRYKNEMKSWEEHMTEIGREDLIRRKSSRVKKTVVAKGGGKKKSKVKTVKAKTTAKPAVSKTSAGSNSRTKTTTMTTPKGRQREE